MNVKEDGEMSIRIQLDYTKLVGDIVKSVFVEDDRCHGNKGDHLTGVMMGFAPNIMGCLHDYRVLIATTIPVSVYKLKEIAQRLMDSEINVTEANVTLTSSNYVGLMSEMGMKRNPAIGDLFGFKTGVHIVTLTITMGVDCKQEEKTE